MGKPGMSTSRHKPRVAGKLSFEDVCQRRATEAALAAARGVIKPNGPIPPLTPVGRLSDAEWGWLVAAILFGWISTRAQQATTENLDTERTIRATALEPDPWNAGAVLAILPDLADACPELDWSLPVTTWSEQTMVEFLLAALRLIRAAVAARDLSEQGITRKAGVSTIARQASAAAGGPLMTADE
jgi:hypothetical protein